MASGRAATVLTINGVHREVEIAPAETLLDVLRDHLGLTGTKEACSRGECGACTVLIDGRPMMSCVTLAGRIDSAVETVEGLAEEATNLRAALADHGGFQCAYCTPGMVVRGIALLRQGLPPSDDDLRRELAGNICRCTGYQGIIEALRQAAAG